MRKMIKCSKTKMCIVSLHFFVDVFSHMFLAYGILSIVLSVWYFINNIFVTGFVNPFFILLQVTLWERFS